MNKQQAMQWLIENITEWPTQESIDCSLDYPWCWMKVTRGKLLFTCYESGMVINEMDWRKARGEK